MRRVNKAELWIFIGVCMTVVIAGLLAVLDRNWTYLGMSILTLTVMLFPSFIEKRFRFEIPGEFEIILILFVYAAIFLGEMNMFYTRIWWWDKMLHSLSGLILGNMGYLIVSYLNSSNRIDVKLSPGFVAFFSFCFAVAMGAVWEMYEYAADNFLGFNMQGGSLNDTMSDIILDTLGGLLFSILGYFQQKGKINIMPKYLGTFK